MKTTHTPSIVILVDCKTRDLPQAALIAHQLEGMGVKAHLEPLEAYRGVLGAYRPDLILFNHLTASHLAEYSRRLAKMGVLTAVLPNEGIMYDPDDLRYSAGKFHTDAHIDLFFCWNETHRQALRETSFGADMRIEVVGVPRFDLYFQPWSHLCKRPQVTPRQRPRLLLCTNFVTAKFAELPRVEGDKFFAAWKDRIPLYHDYWSAIEAHHRGRARIPDFLRALLADGRFDVTLRSHPREDSRFYKDVLAALPTEQRNRVELDSGSNITELILDCDLEISVENCLTALESWIAGKPSLEILLEQHPLWHMAEPAVCGLPCARPENLPAMCAQALEAAPPAELIAKRQAHLRKWCNMPDGRSSERVAQVIANALATKKAADWTQLNVEDHRRAMKLKLFRSLGLAYHYDPFMPLKRILFGDRHAIKDYAYRKSILPADVAKYSARIKNLSVS